jgi:hypothetical protein
MAVVITGNNTPTAGGITYGDGTTYANTAAGTSGQPVVSGGAGAPVFRPYTLPAADGSASQVLQTNGSGALSFATPSSGALTLLSTVTASSSATVNFDSTYITSTYDAYMIVMNSVLPVTNAVNISINASSNNGSSFPYSWTNTGTGFSSNGTSAQGTGGGQNNLTGGLVASAVDQKLTNAAGQTFNCTLYLFKPSATQYFQCTWNATWISNESSALCWVGMSGTTNSSTAVNYIRFAMSSGNIASGTFRLYGLANS